MKRHLVCFLVILSIILSGVQIVLAQDIDKINSLLQKGTWKLTYHDTGMRWRKLEFYTFQNAFIVDVVFKGNYVSEVEDSMLYQVYSSNAIRFVCPNIFMPFPQSFKAEIVKLSEKALILKVGKGLDVFLREDVKPELPPASLKKCWHGSGVDKGKKIEAKLCFHTNKVELFGKKEKTSLFKVGDFPFRFFNLGTPSLVEIDLGEKYGTSHFLLYPKKIVEESGTIYSPVE